MKTLQNSKIVAVVALITACVGFSACASKSTNNSGSTVASSSTSSTTTVTSTSQDKKASTTTTSSGKGLVVKEVLSDTGPVTAPGINGAQPISYDDLKALQASGVPVSTDAPAPDAAK